MGAKLRNHAGPDVEPGLPDAKVRRDGFVIDVDRVTVADEDRVIALVVLLVDTRLPHEVHRLGKRVLIGDLVRVLLDLDRGEVDREGREHAELQVEIARAVLGGEDARDAVLARLDLELLEVAELDRAGNIGAEVVGHVVVASRDGGIVCLELDVPGLAIGLRGDEVIRTSDGAAASRDAVALELGIEQSALGIGRLSRLLGGIGLRREVKERVGRLLDLRHSLFLGGHLVLHPQGNPTTAND